MSELDLDAIRARCEAATPGPWSAYNANEGTEYLPAWEVANDAYHNPPADEDAPWIAVHLETGVRDDAEFIAAARSDVPDLLAALASSRAEVERLTKERDQYAAAAWGQRRRVTKARRWPGEHPADRTEEQG